MQNELEAHRGETASDETTAFASAEGSNAEMGVDSSSSAAGVPTPNGATAPHEEQAEMIDDMQLDASVTATPPSSCEANLKRLEEQLKAFKRANQDFELESAELLSGIERYTALLKQNIKETEWREKAIGPLRELLKTNERAIRDVFPGNGKGMNR
jgi:hypothetical protein